MSIRARSWVETILSVMTGGLAMLTAIHPAWIEAVFGFDPDGGGGLLEWGITFAFLGATIALGLLARRDYVRAS